MYVSAETKIDYLSATQIVIIPKIKLHVILKISMHVFSSFPPQNQLCLGDIGNVSYGQ